MIFYCILTAVVNALASLVLGIAVYFRNRHERKNQIFTWFTATVGTWSTFYLLWQLSKNAEDALFYSRCLTAVAILVPVAYFHFVIQLLGLRWPLHVLAGYGATVILAIGSFTPWLVASVEPRGGFPFWPVPAAFYPIYLGIFFYFVVLTVKLLFSEYKRSSGRIRNQLRYVALGTSIGFLGGTTNFFLWYDIPIPPVGNGFVAIYVIGVGYAIIRFRLLEFNVLFARAVVYFVIIFVMGLMVDLIIQFSSFLPEYIIAEKSVIPAFLASLLMVACMFLWLPALKRRLDGFLESRVLGKQLPDRARLRFLAQRISSIQDEEEIFRETVRSISEAFNVTQVNLFLRLEFDSKFQSRAATANSAKIEAFAESDPLLELLQTSRRCLLLDELQFEAQIPAGGFLEVLRRDQKIDLVVPVYADACFYGFITLGARNRGVLFADADISLLETIALQLGLNLRSRQLERQANQTEKLIALGTLAAGLAHEIRNPLVSIRTFSELIGEQGADPEFRREFKSVVGRDVSRIATIVENISAFADNAQVKTSSVDIHEVINGVYDIARPEFMQAGVGFEAPSTALHLVSGNYSQLLQVFLNLFQNAIHALEGRPEPKVTVGYRLVNDDEGGRTLIVSVSDNGAGIDDVVRARIFDPFITTKATGDGQKRGMGLGLAIVKRIVEGHRGAITVTSEAGRGTTFFVHLPCLS